MRSRAAAPSKTHLDILAALSQRSGSVMLAHSLAISRTNCIFVGSSANFIFPNSTTPSMFNLLFLDWKLHQEKTSDIFVLISNILHSILLSHDEPSRTVPRCRRGDNLLFLWLVAYELLYLPHLVVSLALFWRIRLRHLPLLEFVPELRQPVNRTRNSNHYVEFIRTS